MSTVKNEKKVIIIGSGFAGLSSACYLAKAGFDVTVVEKNKDLGGRARVFREEGFTFDMGPSWYWMPEIFEKFFADFGKEVSDYYELVRLDPGFKVFGRNNEFNLPAVLDEVYELFERFESGSSIKLKQLLKDGATTFDNGINDYMLRPSKNIFEFADIKFLNGIVRAGALQSYGEQINKRFTSESLRLLLNFPVLFLGGAPKSIPYLYSLMPFTMIQGSTWYPMGGMNKIVEGMVELGLELGVNYQKDLEISKIISENSVVSGVEDKYGNKMLADYVIGAGDYHYIEQNLLEPQFRRYNESYWQSRVLSPSSLIFYIGVNKKLPNLEHHTLFFDTDFDLHASEIYESKIYPSDPLFYVCTPSKTDPSVAPDDMENLFVLIPLAPGLEDSPEMREKYFKIILERMASRIGVEFSEDIIYKRSYCINDFENDYHSYKGNAYGLANTLMQTAVFKPKIQSKLKYLYFAGQLTVPGPGIPPTIFSGKIVANEIIQATKAIKN